MPRSTAVQDEPEIIAAPPRREPPEPPRTRSGAFGRVLAAMSWLRRNAYLMVIAAAILVVTRAIDFSPPPEVRVGNANVGQLVGDAPPQ
ncbi:MAG: hypothetical protein IAG13_22985, partial [Deltaproteobacteria bacterium]|nr:hypothetical protein [Nannocystaceae bacterium]